LGGHIIEKKDICQSHLCWGLFGPKPSDKEYATGEVITNLLGGNSSSRLYQIVREQKGLAYSVNMDIEPLIESTILTGYVGLDGNNINAVKDIVKTELNKLKTDNISDGELERTKSYIKGTTLISLETTSGKNRFLNNSIINGLDTNFENYLKDIDNVTVNDIKNFANKYFKDDNICFTQVIPK
jgi:predicted Zn-dependent peptidase